MHSWTELHNECDSNSKKPLSIRTEATNYDNKGRVNVSVQRSSLKATEINGRVFSFQKISFKASNNEGNRGQGEKNLH